MKKNVLQLSLQNEKDVKSFKNKAFESVIALLNSKGGTLTLKTGMKADEIIRPIEQSVEKYIATFEVTKKLRSFSSPSNSNQKTLEVKEYGSLCTMNFNLCIPTETQVKMVKPHESETVKELLVNTNRFIDVTETDKTVPTEFILHRPIGVTESKTVQFKSLKSAKSSGSTDLAKRLYNNQFTRCVSAFANYCGGRLFCGVGDDGTVEGQDVADEEKEDLTKKISKYINEMIWPEHCGEPKRGRYGQWDISFEPVTDEKGIPIQSKVVIVIFVDACPGGVFCSKPESYHIVDGEVKRMTFAEWKRKFFNLAERETELVPRVSWCDWSSPNLKRRCDLLDGKLLRIINNGEWVKGIPTDKAVKEALKDVGENDEVRLSVHLVLLTKWLMYHYRIGQYKEAEEFYAEFDNQLSKAKDVLIFEVRIKLVLSAMERSRGDHKKSYEIARDLLTKVEQIAPSILTVEFYAHFASMLTIIKSNKDLYDTLLKENMKTGSLKDEAISFYNKALQHSQKADYVPKSKVDMEQKTLINMAFLHLGCSLSGDVEDNFVRTEDIENAEACLKKVCESEIDSTPLSNFRSCHLHFAKSCCSYRKSQLVQPTEDSRIDFLESAIREVEVAKDRADKHHFDELSRYATKHAQVFENELEKVESEN